MEEAMHHISEVHLGSVLPVCGGAVQGARKPVATRCMVTGEVLLALSTSPEETRCSIERTRNTRFGLGGNMTGPSRAHSPGLRASRDLQGVGSSHTALQRL